jgi:predicted nucleic acid-binding protein
MAAPRKLRIDAVHARRRVELYSRTASSHCSRPILAALLAGCRTLYSEDLQSGFRIETLEIRNPFA